VNYLNNKNLRVIVIAHGGVDEDKLTNNIEQIMSYRTGGDGHSKCEWNIVEAVIEDIINKRSPDFKKVLEDIRRCKIVPKIRKLIFELEILIAPISIKLQGIGFQNRKSSINVTKEVADQLQYLLFKKDEESPEGDLQITKQKTHSKVSLEKLLEDGKYTKRPVITECLNNFKTIIDKLKMLIITEDDCRKFLDNLDCITKEVFFS
jgi:hypothetical protein